MPKYLLIPATILIIGCSSTKRLTYNKDFSLKDEINKSVIDGFYDGDTTGISKNVYLLK